MECTSPVAIFSDKELDNKKIIAKERNRIVNKEELLEKTWEHDLFKMYVDERSHMFKVEKIDASYDIPFGITVENIVIL